MSSDMDIVFQEENDWRQLEDALDMQAEMMRDQEDADRAVLARMRNGTTIYGDYLYMVGRLNYNLNDLEK